MEYTAKEWYDKGYWFRKGGYWYRHEVDYKGLDRGVYCGAGTYPRCERTCFPMAFEELMERGYRPTTVRELIIEMGFRPSEWSVPVCDGSVDLKKLWQYICGSFEGDNFQTFLINEMQVSQTCREFFKLESN